MNPWMIIALMFIALSIYLGVRVYRLHKGLSAVLTRLDKIERKVPVLRQ